VARVLLQGREILAAAIMVTPVNADAVSTSLHAIKEALIVCQKAASHVIDHVAAKDAQWTVMGKGPRSIIPSLPQVPDLELTATQFLISAKRAIGGICALVPHFLTVERIDTNFDHLADRVDAALGPTAPLTLFLREYSEPSRYLINLRNGQEHPRSDRATVIHNVRVQPDGTVAAPTWFVTGDPPRPIHLEMAVAIDRMVEMAETMLILLVDERLDTRWPFVINEIDPSERNPDLPIRYRIGLDMSRLRSPS
jgi:hypothetical protein